jgi:hypothetical protein
VPTTATAISTPAANRIRIKVGVTARDANPLGIGHSVRFTLHG